MGCDFKRQNFSLEFLGTKGEYPVLKCAPLKSAQKSLGCLYLPIMLFNGFLIYCISSKKKRK